MSIYVAGLDLGQAQDFTALVICELRGTPIRVPYKTELLGIPLDQYIPTESTPLARMNILHIERFQLGTKYQRIAQIISQRAQYIPNPRYLAVDQTGVGMGVLEMLNALNPIGITITGGNEVTSPSRNRWRVPKRDLVSALQVMSQQRAIFYHPEMPFVQDLIREMENFRVKISVSGHDTYEAWREGVHDDLVLAAAMAVWTGELIIRTRLGAALDALNAQAAAVPYEIGA